MADTPPREQFRSFTLRVPQSLYIELAEMARADGVFINQKANQLIRLGMGRDINLTETLKRLVQAELTRDEQCLTLPTS